MEDTEMTIMEAIKRIDAVKPNSYLQGEKIRWLNALDGMVKSKVIDTHQGADAVVFEGYTEDTPLGTALLVPAPYDEMYIFWLESKIDYWNGETGKYNNSISMFNTAYSEYERFYNRTHMPIGENLNYFGKSNGKTPVWQAANGLVKVTIEEV
jgi:hypothetical protein